MKTQWGRDETYRWPSRKPVWTITALVLGVVAILGTAVYQYEMRWTALERYWFPSYLKMQFLGWLGLKTNDYRLLEVVDRKGVHRVALEQDVIAWEGPLPRGYTVPLTLSDEAARQNLRLVLQPKASYKNKELSEYIRHWIYQDQTFGEFMYWPLSWGLAIFVGAMVFAIPKDMERRRVLKYGRRTKGPELVTAAEFNRANESDGVGFITKERRTFAEFLLRHDGKMVRVPRERESSHIMMMGDTGAGKSSLIRQILMQVAEARGIKMRRVGKNLMGLCPFHQDKNPSLSITPDVNKWHCLGCGKGGTAIDWVMCAEGVSTRHALEMLSRDLVPMTSTSGGPPPKRTTVPKLPPLIEQTNDDKKLVEIVVSYYHKTLKEKPDAQQYLVKRGLKSAEMVEHFRLGYSNRTLGYHMPASTRLAGAEQRGRLIQLGIYRESGHEHFSGALVVPIFNLNGEAVQMYGRKITANLHKDIVRHLYLPGPLRGVWNEQALIASKEIILCEALIDALTFWCAGYRNVATIYGVNNFTDDLRAAFQQHGTKRIYIAYDRDDAGEKAAQAHGEELMQMGVECFRVQFPKGQDANEYAHDTASRQGAWHSVDQRGMARHRKAARRECHQARCDRNAADRGGAKRTSEKRNPFPRQHKTSG